MLQPQGNWPPGRFGLASRIERRKSTYPRRSASQWTGGPGPGVFLVSAEHRGYQLLEAQLRAPMPGQIFGVGLPAMAVRQHKQVWSRGSFSGFAARIYCKKEVKPFRCRPEHEHLPGFIRSLDPCNFRQNAEGYAKAVIWWNFVRPVSFEPLNKCTHMQKYAGSVPRTCCVCETARHGTAFIHVIETVCMRTFSAQASREHGLAYSRLITGLSRANAIPPRLGYFSCCRKFDVRLYVDGLPDVRGQKEPLPSGRDWTGELQVHSGRSQEAAFSYLERDGRHGWQNVCVQDGEATEHGMGCSLVSRLSVGVHEPRLKLCCIAAKVRNLSRFWMFRCHTAAGRSHLRLRWQAQHGVAALKSFASVFPASLELEIVKAWITLRDVSGCGELTRKHSGEAACTWEGLLFFHWRCRRVRVWRVCIEWTTRRPEVEEGQQPSWQHLTAADSSGQSLPSEAAMDPS